MNAIVGYWAGHGTKVLGTLAAIVAGLLLVPDLIPAAHMKFWQAANVVLGVLTVQRGFANSQAQADAPKA